MNCLAARSRLLAALLIGHIGLAAGQALPAQAVISRLHREAPNVTRELVRRGYDEAQIAKIWGGNFLRVFGEAEAVSRRLRKPGE
jgi:membrane dipeptidase